jgi:hypothetical protein
MKVGDHYRLKCGHDGTVAGVYNDRIAVKGHVVNRCDGCSKRYDPWKAWNRMPTVYIIALEE